MNYNEYNLKNKKIHIRAKILIHKNALQHDCDLLEELIVNLLTHEELAISEINSYNFKTLTSKDLKNVNLITDIYDLTKKLKKKITKIDNLLKDNSFGERLNVKKSIYSLKLLMTVDDRMINIDNLVLCGRNSSANNRVWNTVERLNWTYYHADVHGGGLIAMQYPNDAVGNSLACLYSKYLKVNNHAQGTSSKSNNVTKTATEGQFLFFNKSTVYEYKQIELNFYQDTENQKFFIGFSQVGNLDKEIELTKKFKKFTFAIKPLRLEKRFGSLKKTFKDITINNLNMLDLIIPIDYTLEQK